MLKRTMLFWAQYILVLPILFLTFMFTGFVGSQLMIGADKQHFIFTPQNATEYSQISEIAICFFNSTSCHHSISSIDCVRTDTYCLSNY
ncbi:hypothetical protein IG9_03894 [Bacillus cereus HuA2-9]|uniref:Uncharacterized protein n=1 Tax=Bacillus cereus HuA2-1 TaxID=1053201 RepID=J9CD64_BACCE|nr:hypothetical protein IG3_00548 [Bacillus cereus HuA2-1]EOO14726.1 hypothetical protein IG9_03894 [Bacillus cereus HuA2-9]